MHKIKKIRCTHCFKVFIFSDNSRMSYLDWVDSIFTHIRSHLNIDNDTRDCKCSDCERIFKDDEEIACIEEFGACKKCYSAYLDAVYPKHPDDNGGKIC